MVTQRKIKIQYFAKLREERGLDEEIVETSAATALELYNQLKDAHQFSLDTNLCKVSINCAFVAWDSELKEGDEIVFIPPVAGG